MLTSLVTAIIGFFYFYVSRKTIKARVRDKVLFGTGESELLTRLVSAHSNLTSYAPLFIILVFLLEIQKFNLIVLSVISALFIVGRGLHVYAMMNGLNGLKARVIGMRLTLMPIMALSLMNIGWIIFTNI